MEREVYLNVSELKRVDWIARHFLSKESRSVCVNVTANRLTISSKKAAFQGKVRLDLIRSSVSDDERLEFIVDGFAFRQQLAKSLASAQMCLTIDENSIAISAAELAERDLFGEREINKSPHTDEVLIQSHDVSDLFSFVEERMDADSTHLKMRESGSVFAGPLKFAKTCHSEKLDRRPEVAGNIRLSEGRSEICFVETMGVISYILGELVSGADANYCLGETPIKIIDSALTIAKPEHIKLTPIDNNVLIEFEGFSLFSAQVSESLREIPQKFLDDNRAAPVLAVVNKEEVDPLLMELVLDNSDEITRVKFSFGSGKLSLVSYSDTSRSERLVSATTAFQVENFEVCLASLREIIKLSEGDVELQYFKRSATRISLFIEDKRVGFYAIIATA